jgi:hypothetical protein
MFCTKYNRNPFITDKFMMTGIMTVWPWKTIHLFLAENWTKRTMSLCVFLVSWCMYYGFTIRNVLGFVERLHHYAEIESPLLPVDMC